ncbi:MAG: ATP-binding protein [Thermoplasmata archaeon]|nr:ATP-binding protein [Thermoplasmata archaeon]
MGEKVRDFKDFDPLEFKGPTPSDINKVLIRGILDSYHSNYDLFAELLQNAVDAIETEYKRRSEEIGKPDKKYIPTVWVRIDLSSNRIQVCDNGPGITWEYFQSVLAPGFTGKTLLKALEKSKLPATVRFRGHKGVGLTYLGYGFNYLQLATKVASGQEPCCGEFTNGRKWAMDDESEEDGNAIPRPKFRAVEETSQQFKEIPSGTCVTIGCDSDTAPRSLRHIATEAKEWEHILRTKTSAGFIDIGGSENWAERATVYLKVRKGKNEGKWENIPFDYWYPHYDKKLSWLNLNDYLARYPGKVGIKHPHKYAYHGIHRTWNGDTVRNELLHVNEKNTKKESVSQILDKYSPNVYAFFAHSAKIWESITSNVTSKDRKFFDHGFQISSEHMPVGTRKDIELEYTASHADRLFVIVEFDGARPDFGRKGFIEEVDRFVQNIAEATRKYFTDHNEFLKPTGQVSRRTRTDREYEIEKIIEEAKKRLDENPLNWVPEAAFLTEPNCEQDVIAVFFELVGHGYLLGYEPLALGLRSTYDCVIQYELDKGTAGALFDPHKSILGLHPDKFGKNGKVKSYPKNLEFKLDLDYLLEEFADKKSNKELRNVTFAVAWESGDRWKKDYKLYSCLDPDFVHFRNYHGVTHVLKHPSYEEEEIQIILLKNIRNFLTNKKVALAKERSEYSNNE